MEGSELVAMRDALVAELAKVEESLSDLSRRQRGLVQTITGLKVLIEGEPLLRPRVPPRPMPQVVLEPAPEVDQAAKKETLGDYPRGTEAIRRVLVEAGRKMDIRELTDDLVKRGWLPHAADPLNATSSNASRACQAIEGVKRERGPRGGFLYWWAEPETDDHEEENDVPASFADLMSTS